MKTTLFTLFALSLGLSVKSFAQCNPSIPSNAIVISTTQTQSSANANYWVCKGCTLTTNAAFETIYLEKGAFVKSSGSQPKIYVPAGATVITASGGIPTIYYVNTGDLQSVTGALPAETQCPSITYNYTNAPTNGCPKCLSSGTMPSGISSSTGSGFCAGKSSTLTQMGGTLNPGAHWAWSNDSCKGAVIDTGASIAVAPTTVTTYYVKVVGDSCNAANCVSITLAPAAILTPIIYGPSGSGNFCVNLGQSTTLSVVNSPCVGGGCVYNWSSGDTGVSISLTPPSLPVTYTVTVSNACGDSVKNSISITDCATGVAAVYGNTDGINIMPNPSHGEFTVLMPQTITDKAMVRIYNILGDAVPFSSSGNANSKNSRDISLERKESGIYFLQILSDDESYTMKLIVN